MRLRDVSRTRIVELEEFGSTIGCGSLMRSGCGVEAEFATGQASPSGWRERRCERAWCKYVKAVDNVGSHTYHGCVHLIGVMDVTEVIIDSKERQ